MVAVIVGNALAQLRLNSWRGAFYDAVALRDLPLFYWNLGLFAVIAGVLLVLGVAQTWLHENLKVKLREAVTFDLIEVAQAQARLSPAPSVLARQSKAGASGSGENRSSFSTAPSVQFCFA